MQIGIVDDRATSTNLTINLIKQYNNCSLLFTANSGYNCLQYLTTHKVLPNLIFMDLSMNKVDGCATTFFIKNNYPNIKIFILTSYANLVTLEQAIISGADGYIFKHERIKIFTEVMNAAFTNTSYVDKRITETTNADIIEEFYKKKAFFWQKSNEVNGKTITENEKKYLQLLATPLTYTEIAELLHVEKRTVETTYKRLYEKLNIAGFKELALFAINNGLATNLNTTFSPIFIEVE